MILSTCRIYTLMADICLDVYALLNLTCMLQQYQKDKAASFRRRNNKTN